MDTRPKFFAALFVSVAVALPAFGLNTGMVQRTAVREVGHASHV